MLAGSTSPAQQGMHASPEDVENVLAPVIVSLHVAGSLM